MKNSLIIMLVFGAGILSSALALLPGSILGADLALYTLYLLLLLVGVSIGSNTETWQTIKTVRFKIVLVPLSVIVGTFLGVSLFWLFVPAITLPEAWAIGAGFGYYSLSSILIAQLRGEALGVVALLANLSREIITMIFAPLLAKYFGKLAPIASGGATAMDITLPVISRFSGKNYAVIALFSGAALSVAVPFLVTLALQF